MHKDGLAGGLVGRGCHGGVVRSRVCPVDPLSDIGVGKFQSKFVYDHLGTLDVVAWESTFEY
jgi:hypothetical protein